MCVVPMESSDEEPRRKEKKHRDEDRVKDKKKHKKEKKEKKHKKDGEHKEKKRKKDKKERKDDETKQKKKRRPHPITKPLPDAIKASGLSPLELEPRKSWRSINPSHKTHCLTMVDHAIMCASSINRSIIHHGAIVIPYEHTSIIGPPLEPRRIQRKLQDSIRRSEVCDKKLQRILM